MSAAVASPVLSRKLQCFSDTWAPPIRRPRQPAASISCQALRPSGLAKVEPPVRTRRGWVVLASDASHFYAHMEQDRVFPIVVDVHDTLRGYQTIRRLATSPGHIIPGHDPLVLARYPAANEGTKGWIVRVDAE